MKNYILKYSSYCNDIFKGEDIEIRLAYFSGIIFNPADNFCFICFDTVTVDNRPLILKFKMEFESFREYNKYYIKYGNLFPMGITLAKTLPSLVAISCFYKQHSKTDEWFLLYTMQAGSEDESVFTITMNQNIFCQIMYIFDLIRKGKGITEDNINILNKFNYSNMDTEMIKLNKYEPSISSSYKLYCKKPSKFAKIFTFYCMVTFTKDDKKFNIVIPVRSKNVYRDYKNKFITSIYDFDKQMTNSKIPTYYITDNFPIEYSLSADTPMNKPIFVGLSVNFNYNYNYFIIPDDLLVKLEKLCFNYVTK